MMLAAQRLSGLFGDGQYVGRINGATFAAVHNHSASIATSMPLLFPNTRKPFQSFRIVVMLLRISWLADQFTAEVVS
jgi:hypothetical protein